MSHNSVTETINKAIPAAVSKVLGDSRDASHRPTKTPSKLVVTKAIAAPAKTIHGDCDSALINSVVTWVLSPSSAKKMVMNVEQNTPQLGERAIAGFCTGAAGGTSTGELEGREETCTGN